LIACNIHDYNSIVYLVNSTSVRELRNIFRSYNYVYLNLAAILIINRPCNMGYHQVVADILYEYIITKNWYIIICKYTSDVIMQ
jgi:hypothetical protein